MRYGLGVDLGTTYTGAAVSWATHAEMFSLGNQGIVAPAVVFARDGRLITGDAAARRALEQPDRSAREFKRRLGDPTPLLLGGTPYSPAILMAGVLSAAVAKVVEAHGEPPEEVVLTRPAVWGPYRCEQFEEVPVLAGLRGVQTVPEPVAAATYYATTTARHEDDVIAVYDLGGGTFDATVVRRRGGDLQILGDPQGIEWLGGIDFDAAVLSYVDHTLGGAVSLLNLSDPHEATMMLRLQQECRLAKEALSAEDDATVRAVLPQGEENVRLTRSEFEELVRPALTSTIEALRRVLESASVRTEDLSAVLLVGGSSRIPLVSRMLESAFQRPIALDAHPKHAVALGAARIARGMLSPVDSPRAGNRAPSQPGGAVARTNVAPEPDPVIDSSPSIPATPARAEASPQPGQPTGRSRLARTLNWLALAAMVAVLVAVGIVIPERSAHQRPTPHPAAGPKLAAPVESSPAPSAMGSKDLTLPPVNGQFDEQIGGAYPPAPSVAIVERDHGDDPVPGKYNICYVNAFETQPDESTFWTGRHASLLLKGVNGKYLSDAESPGTYILDTSTAAGRAGIARIVNGWIDSCAQKGYRAVDPDNLDSWTASLNRLSEADNVALATLLADHAHTDGLAIAQKNAAELGRIGKTKAKFDFVIDEECQMYGECITYTRTYGVNVIEIEYANNPIGVYLAACSAQGRRISVILRDRGVVPRGHPGYDYKSC